MNVKALNILTICLSALAVGSLIASTFVFSFSRDNDTRICLEEEIKRDDFVSFEKKIEQNIDDIREYALLDFSLNFNESDKLEHGFINFVTKDSGENYKLYQFNKNIGECAYIISMPSDNAKETFTQSYPESASTLLMMVSVPEGRSEPAVYEYLNSTEKLIDIGSGAVRNFLITDQSVEAIYELPDSNFLCMRRALNISAVNEYYYFEK